VILKKLEDANETDFNISKKQMTHAKAMGVQIYGKI
jgi:hypothetical protein